MTLGSFGYKVGKKVRLMEVSHDANLLWQIAVREVYVLMHHYQTIEALRRAFDELKEVKEKQKPSKAAVEKCSLFLDASLSDDEEVCWRQLTGFCQHSFINVLESGVMLNNGLKRGLTLLVDFNTETVRFYEVDSSGKETEYDRATVTEIMAFEDMPTKTYMEIVGDMRQRHQVYTSALQNVENELSNLQLILDKAKELGNEQNIIQKARKLMDDMQWQKKKLYMERRVFYHRLDALDLIDHTS